MIGFPDIAEGARRGSSTLITKKFWGQQRDFDLAGFRRQRLVIPGTTTAWKVR